MSWIVDRGSPDDAALTKLASLNPPQQHAAAAETASGGAASSLAHSRTEGKRATAGGGASISGTADRIGGDFAVSANPEWIAKRLAVLERIKERNAAAMAGLSKPAIVVTLPDGKQLDGTAWETSPLAIAEGISSGLAKATCVASVKYSKRLQGFGAAVVDADREDGTEGGAATEEAGWELWDVTRALEGDCELKLHKFDDAEGNEVFWHSSAHILGQALETLYGCKLTHGPPLEPGAPSGGFFYDSYMGDVPFNTAMAVEVEKAVKKVCDAKQPFERVVVSKADALELFADNPFKVAIISSKLPDDASTTVYRNGPFVDLCRGPHLPSTHRVQAFAVTKNSGSLWLGKAGNDPLQRVYGITFPKKEALKEWKALQAEAAKRDHRAIGVAQELFFFDDLSPGSCFFLPHGCRLYNRLMEVIREQYWRRGYSEVVTPNMYNLHLWHTSGHAAKYKENMFCIDIEGQEFGLKPMNCPGHCLMFKHRKRSYRELPWRVADFGVLHRNELSGALTGLTRVRRFQQDDAHIFCMVSQIKQEVAGALDFIQTVYGFLGMTFTLKLSTKPESALGDPEVWETAERYMMEALNEFQEKTGHSWSLNPGDGAFYGPKIDVQVYDALKRLHQCATVQLDFVQPQRFDLKYQAQGEGAQGDGYERPVMVHRAVLGSVERMIAILTEHFAGKWPFFLSPRQAQVVPVNKVYNEYAMSVQQKLHAAGFHADVDLSQNTLPKMIRNAQQAQYNFILVVGEKEADTRGVTVRTRDSNEVAQDIKPLDDLIAEWLDIHRNKSG